MSPLAPTGFGTIVPSIVTTFTKVGLTPGTNYWGHVRDSCSATERSAWATIPFQTMHATGVTNVTGNDFDMNVYPNPVKEVLTVEIAGTTGNAQVQLYDVTGKLIRTIDMHSNKANIEMNGLAAGMYLVRYTDSEHTQTVKVTKN